MSRTMAERLRKRLHFKVSEVTPEEKGEIIGSLVFQEGVDAKSPIAGGVVDSNPPAFKVHLDRRFYGTDVFLSHPTISVNADQDDGKIYRPWTAIYMPVRRGFSRSHESHLRESDDENPETLFRFTPAYQSSSHGLWRILPTFLIARNWTHYDKGHGESSITLPLVSQLAISSIVDDKGHAPSHELNFLEDITQLIEYRAGYYAEADMPELSGCNSNPDPSNLKVFPRLEPDFEAFAGPFQHHTERYGTIKMYGVLSRDKRFMWTFGHLTDSDESDVSWVANVEACSPLTCSGVPRRSLGQLDSIITPPQEYAITMGENGSRYKSFAYCMKIPQVKEFRRRVLGKN